MLIIGILAAIAVPQYQKAVEKSRMAEAWLMLGVLNQAEQRKNLEMGTTNIDYLWDQLDIDFSTLSCNDWQCKITSKYFDYTMGFVGQYVPVATSKNHGYHLSFDSTGKKTCLEKDNEPEGACKKYAGFTKSGNACVTGGNCFTE